MKFVHSARRLSCLLFLTTIFFSGAIAAIPGSTFISQGDQAPDVTISVNIPSDPTNDDIFFHISAAAGQAWLGFGFGTQMLDALIFVAYTTQDGKNVTISPRIGLYHEEPQYTHAVGVSVLEGSYVDNETYNINARCTSCRSWPLPSGERGKIDAKSTAQPMLYAIGGQDASLQTDSQEGEIKQHIAYGKYTIDLQAATGEAGVPNHSTTETGITQSEALGKARLVTILHGLIMAACFVVFFPLGALVTRLPLRLAFWLHVIWQCCTTIGVLIGFTLGIYNSIHNNEHPKLNSPHQALGLTVVVLILVQPTLGFRGFLHNRHHPKSQTPTLAGKIHRFLGPAIILAGIVNGALGLTFANDTARLPAYFGAFVFITIIYMLTQWIFRRRTMRNRAVNSVRASNFRDGAPPYAVRLRNYARQGNLSHPSHLSHRSDLSGQNLARAEQTPAQYVHVIPKDEEQRMS